ncbi:hypothetical protein ACTXT7_002098 [Hymenolepis weldensis]
MLRCMNIDHWLAAPILRLLGTRSVPRAHFPECYSLRGVPLDSLGSVVCSTAKGHWNPAPPVISKARNEKQKSPLIFILSSACRDHKGKLKDVPNYRGTNTGNQVMFNMGVRSKLGAPPFV